MYDAEAKLSMFLQQNHILRLFCVDTTGSDLVEWLNSHVEGFADRRDARKYANNLLKAGYIRHTVNKITFSEQCYYVFGDLCQGAFANC